MKSENIIYLDYNATAPLRVSAREALIEATKNAYNASSIHSLGRKGRSLIEQTREDLGKAINCPPAQIIFNSGATEGNNTVLKHFANETIITSAIEHPSVLESMPAAIRAPVLKNGVIDLDKLKELVKTHKPALVSIMAINNETGVIQPVKDIAEIAHNAGALYHCDGVQALGRIPLDMQDMGIDFLTLSAHKIGGPQGVGALAVRLCGENPILLQGGGQEKSQRAGTENVAGIASFGAALNETMSELNNYQNHYSALLKPIIETLNTMDGVTIHGLDAPRTANTLSFSIEGTSSETLLMSLDLEGIALSNGSACSSGKVEASYVLLAMGCSEKCAKAVLRVSAGYDTKRSDIDVFLQKLLKITERIRKK